MSLSQALALVSARKGGKGVAPSGPQKRGRGAEQQHDNDDLFASALEKVDEVAVVKYPNITIYGGDYSGNILGCRICPPLYQGKKTQSNDEEFSDSDDEDNKPTTTKSAQDKARVSVLARALAREKGIDPILLEQRRQLKHSLNLRPVVSGELHAGSVGSIASFNRFVITAGLQDENIKLSKRDLDQSINRLKEFGALHRHDSTITTVVFTPSNHGQLCLSGSENGIIYVWSPLNQWDCIGVLRTHTARIVSITPHPTANMALSLSIDNKLVMWDLRPGCFAPVFTTQLRYVKPSWGTQSLPPMAMLFSPDGTYYSVLYNRCVHTYHTTGEHAGKIMSILNLPDGISTLWSSIQYLDTSHLICGNEKGEMYIYNIVSTEQLAVLTGAHQYRVKNIVVIPQTHSQWLHEFIEPLAPKAKAVVPSPVATKGTPNKKQKPNMATQQPDPTETTFVVSADSDGKIVLWQVDATITGSKTVTIQPKAAQKNRHDVEDLDQLDEIDVDAGSDETQKPKFSYPVLTSTATILGARLCHLSTNTRITCLCLALPFDGDNLNPLGNQYREMGHVMETQNESKTQYEDATDAIYRKQYQEHARKFKQQKDDDFKLRVRDYHRMKAGKIKSLAEGDAVKATSKSTLGDGTPKNQRDRYRKMDEEFQKEHKQRQADKASMKGGSTADGGQKKRMTRLEAKVAKRNNPALAGTLKARKRNGGKKGPTARGKRRF